MVATVNEVEVSRESFVDRYQSTVEEIRKFGLQDPDGYTKSRLTSEILDNEINIQVLLNAVFNEGIEASEEEANAKLQEFADSLGYDSLGHLLTTLEEEGNTRENVMLAASQQVQIEKLYWAHMVLSEPSDAELEERYAMSSSRQLAKSTG